MVGQLYSAKSKIELFPQVPKGLRFLIKIPFRKLRAVTDNVEPLETGLAELVREAKAKVLELAYEPAFLMVVLTLRVRWSINA